MMMIRGKVVFKMLIHFIIIVSPKVCCIVDHQPSFFQNSFIWSRRWFILSNVPSQGYKFQPDEYFALQSQIWPRGSLFFQRRCWKPSFNEWCHHYLWSSSFLDNASISRRVLRPWLTDWLIRDFSNRVIYVSDIYQMSQDVYQIFPIAHLRPDFQSSSLF